MPVMPDWEAHNQQVRRLWQEYHDGTNGRVPVTLAFDEQFLLHHWGCTFERYYRDVPTQLDLQLRSQEWVRTSVLQDAEMGLPAAWTVCPPSWMDENEFLGAAIVAQENDYSWGQPLPLTKTELLRHLQSLDVETQIRRGTLHRQWEALKRLTDGREHCGRPVQVASPPVGSTHGLFTKAAEIRGLEQLCLDLVEDAPFAHELLAVVTDLALQRLQCWHRLAGTGRTFPSDEGWGLCDDSLTLISRTHYEEFVLPYHERIYSALTRGPRHIHLCGHVQHLFATLHHKLGITTFDGPGTQVDIPRMVEEIGAPITIQAQISHGILGSSPPEIEAAVRYVLDDRAKRRARMTLLGYATRGAPLEHLRFFYECGLRHGEL